LIRGGRDPEKGRILDSCHMPTVDLWWVGCCKFW